MRARLLTFGLLVALFGLLTAPMAALAAAPRAQATTDGFTDVPTTHPNYAAIAWLAERGVLKGYGDGTFGAADPIVRGQVAGALTRPLGWQFEQWAAPFPDQGTLDADLWRNVGTLSHYGVARGFSDGTFQPLGNVAKAQVISFITRAMETKGYWQAQPDTAGLYTEVPGTSGHRADLATYQKYVGGIYGTPNTRSFADWSSDASRAWVAQVLYDALKLMPAVSVPVTGSGSFSGVLNLIRFAPSASGGIDALVNVVNGAGQVVAANVTVPVDLAATAAANRQLAQGGAGAQATCDVLNLVLGALDLNLLGLVVHLDQVVLNITAQTGANALLGNLLCGILGLLNPLGAIADILGLLNQLADLLNQLGLGNLAANAPATVTGAMQLDNFSRTGDQILANGTLGGQAVRAPLALAAAQPGQATAQATCDVLNLVLGPLDLNLLGLKVNLNQVILNIVAQTGASNLLGNLLCSVAGLLSPISSLSQLLDLLNTIVRAL